MAVVLCKSQQPEATKFEGRVSSAKPEEVCPAGKVRLKLCPARFCVTKGCCGDPVSAL